MRQGVVATAICMTVAGLSNADEVRASIRKSTNIPAQSLAEALQGLARDRNFQIIYVSEDISDRRTAGAVGEYTLDEALKQLLIGTGLTYKYLDEKTVTIFPLTQPNSPGAQSGLTDTPTPPAASNEEIKGSSNSLRQAQTPDAAAAQPATVEQGSDATQKKFVLEEVVVTGTHLKTDKTASPMTVITKEDIKKQGLSTVDDIVRSLPQNYSTINAGSTLDNALNPIGAQGQASADLRGLGSQNTLILVNGRRRAASSTFGDGTVNLNTIPVSAIERVEVITDGASAIYGSDAVAGVINFILKKNYEGAETHVRQELGSNGGDAVSADQSLGLSWSSGNITMGGRYARSNPVLSNRAGLTTENFSARGGSDLRTTYLGQPGVVLDPMTGAVVGSLPAGDSGNTGIAGKLSPANTVAYDAARYPFDVVSRRTTLSFDVNAEQSLSEWARAYAEVSYANNTSHASAGAPLAPYVTVPTTNHYNDSGAPVLVNYVFGQEYLDGLVGNSYASDQRSLAATLGWKITLPRDWTADISGNHSREDASQMIVMLDPAVLAERAAGIDAHGIALPASQQLNLFGNGSAQSAAALAGLMSSSIPGTYTPSNISTTDSALLSAEGPLLSLPGGAVRLATGTEFRREKFDYTGDSSRTGLYVDNPSRKVAAVYGETNVPLLGEANRVAGIYALDLFAAARWERYSISGQFAGLSAPSRTQVFSQTSPKFGVSWYPWSPLKLRATYSHAFRAPALTDLFDASSGPYNFFGMVDPRNPSAGVIYPDVYNMGNPALRPETSDNLSAGLDWKPRGFLQGLSVALSYNKINFKNVINGLGTIAAFTPELLFNVPGVVERDAGGNISRINLGPVNIAGEHSQNVDFSTTYIANTPSGDWVFGLNGTYALQLTESTVPGATPLILVGTEAGPEKVKLRGSVGWSRAAYGLNLYANYSGHYLNNNFGGSGPQPVASYLTFDLTGSYNLRGVWSLSGGARNLLNRSFPFFNNAAGSAVSGFPWDSRRVDLRGRVIYLEVARKFDWSQHRE